jgi:hypothetical protein
MELSPKLSIDATKAIVFCVVFIGVVILIAFGKLDSEYLKYLLAWLIPGPLNFEKDPAAEKKAE